MKTNRQKALELIDQGTWYDNAGIVSMHVDEKEAVKIASIQDVQETVTEQIQAIPQRPQVQYDLQRQLMELRIAANKLGLYDAADFLRTFTENK